MGTDIHTACEVRRDTFWVNSGSVFASDYDWAWRTVYEPAEAIDLSDYALLKGVAYELEPRPGDAGEGSHHGLLRPFLRAETLVEVDAFRARLEAVEAEHGAYREAKREGDWDYYGDVKPHHDRLHRALRDSTELSLEARLDVLEVLCAHNRRVRDHDEHDEESDWSIEVRLERLDDEPRFKTGHPYEGRCYDLFGALADVRNGSGFAGVVTGRAVEPVAMPRGLPSDVTEETLKLISHEHTPTWLLLSELEAYDWDRPKMHRTVVSEDLLLKMREVGTTDPWHPDVLELYRQSGRSHPGTCGGIHGANIITFDSVEEYDLWVTNGRPELKVLSSGLFGQLKSSPGDGIDMIMQVGGEDRATTVTEPVVYVSTFFSKVLRDSISPHFFEFTLPTMRSLIPEGGDADDVRMVFDFDS